MLDSLIDVLKERKLTRSERGASKNGETQTAPHHFFFFKDGVLNS